MVGADKSKIALGGFPLTGNRGSVGIDNDGGFDGVTIENGAVEEFDDCLSIGGHAKKNVISDLRVFGGSGGSGDGIDLNDSDLATIENTLLTGNGAAGIQIGSGATGNRVEESYAIGNAGAGIQIEGSDNTVTKSHATANAESINENLRLGVERGVEW